MIISQLTVVLSALNRPRISNVIMLNSYRCLHLDRRELSLVPARSCPSMATTCIVVVVLKGAQMPVSALHKYEDKNVYHNS
jgi:hypothetical protein